MADGRIRLLARHELTDLIVEDGAVAGVRCRVLAADDSPRGESTNREQTGDAELRAGAVLIATGGIGGSEELVRSVWPERLGPMPRDIVFGVPDTVDGTGMLAAQRAGGSWINRDRMWHYTEGIANHDPIWRGHGIRILPGPSSLWIDARGRRLDAPAYPGFDTLATLAQLGERGYEHSWFITNRRIVAKEFTLSGSEQNPDLTGRDWRLVAGRIGGAPTPPVQAFLDRGVDFLEGSSVAELAAKMNGLIGEDLIDGARLETLVEARDAELANTFTKDRQITAIRGARRFVGDRLIRVTPPHRLTDPKSGPLVAVRLRTLLRKTLGGLETDLSGRVLAPGGVPIDGLYAAGEASGFGGGGMHGYSALEGTFLGGCLFSGREAGRGMVVRLR